MITALNLEEADAFVSLVKKISFETVSSTVKRRGESAQFTEKRATACLTALHKLRDGVRTISRNYRKNKTREGRAKTT